MTRRGIHEYLNATGELGAKRGLGRVYRLRRDHTFQPVQRLLDKQRHGATDGQ